MIDIPDDYISNLVSRVLCQLEDGIKLANDNGVVCYMPDKVSFDLQYKGEHIVFDVPTVGRKR